MKKLIIIVIALGVIGAGGFIYWESQTDEVETVVSFDPQGLISLDEWQAEQEKVAKVNLQTKAQELMEQGFSLLAVGDVMLSRMVGQKMVKYDDYHYPFLKVQSLLSSADITFGNLESPIIAGSPVLTGSFVFRADPETAESLDWAGFDVMTLANNHSLNKDEAGLQSTFDHLKKYSIDYFGAAENLTELDNQLVIKEVNKYKVGFLGYAYGPDYYEADNGPGIALMQESRLVKDVQNAKEKVDFLVVSMHDGVEYEHESNVHQQKFAHLAIDQGADLVIGHHPHVVQELEIYKDKYIFYSLGNFVFDQMWSEETRQGLAVKLRINMDGVQEVEYFPVVIEDFAQPRLADEKEQENIMKYLQLKD
ncbi:CapA family protein [Candidatus Falkowbacteria bacterium]|jgi:poly-gamma-glutamate capsule biosynthesis protein CapA/YwtB (metallophosphatase superfamily)|nr:CapA family protein [Candidatus Falkowbacteria bacterium]MBT5503645.1 CapA family protein [Candidatus Falkowbacteria bacterium]MBT6574109.1 CapA family protein [Candidatus Falkowbacteria bacterium]MBT7500685.1 CapA family protein [Candidatus Falkowbacteria bacterium]